MHFELFGIARIRAGTEVVHVDASNLGDAMRGLADVCPGLEPEVLTDGWLTDGYVVSLNGERFVTDKATPLADDDTVLILGAQAGG